MTDNSVDSLTEAISKLIKQAHDQKADVAEVLSVAIGDAAHLVGGLEELLIHRSGSWEAAAVRQLADQTHFYAQEKND